MATKATVKLSVPSTLEEFVNSGWYSKLHTLVSKYRLTEPIEDVMQDIMMELACKQYVERYVPESGSFSNWIYTFAGNICKKKYNRSHTKGGYAIETAYTIEPSPISEASFKKGAVFEDMMESSIFEDGELSITISQIEQELKKIKGSSSNEFEGVVYQRDAVTVFRLLVQDYSAKEIAERFHTSVEFVYTLLRKIRTVCTENGFLAIA